MTRRPQLISTLLCYVSGAALTVGVWTSPQRSGHSLDPALGFLVRLGLWFRLIFGIESASSEICAYSEPDFPTSRHQRRADRHRAKCRASARKHPAHDLEMIMRFVPDASGRGLTLNQYRERFTRISVMGRALIYCGFFSQLKWLRRYRTSSAVIQNPSASCQAPLRPD